MNDRADRYAPSKIDLQKVRESLSRSQMEKIAYECDLLRTDPQKLLYLAPHLFVESVDTEKDTHIEDESIKKEEKTVEDEETYPTYDSYGDDEVYIGYPA